MGFNPGSCGTLLLRGAGVVQCNYVLAGWYGTATIVQDGGELDVPYHLEVPFRFTVDHSQPPATYILNDGTLNTGPGPSSTDRGTSVGTAGEGVFIQNGGWHQTSVLWLGYPSYGKSTYVLNGGMLNITSFGNMLSSDGSFLQNGGTLAAAAFGIGGPNWNFHDTFELHGGVLRVGTFDLNHYSTFKQTGGMMLLQNSFENDGTAIFGGAESWSAGAQFTNFGYATFASDTGSDSAPNVAVTVAWSNTLSTFPDSVVTFDSSQHLASLNVVNGTVVVSAGGNKLLSTGSLQVGGKIDLNDNGLIWHYDTTRDFSPAGVVRNLIASARYAGGTWHGMGISSSMADAQQFGIGYWDPDQGANPTLPVFKPERFRTEEILAARTYYGDANGDGKVDVTDLAALAQHWQSPGYWYEGDFNYDGFVDVADLGLLATNWQAGVGNPLGPSLADALASLGLSSVPEPATLTVVVLVSLLATRSRSVPRGRVELVGRRR